jgi:hypothetical protein
MKRPIYSIKLKYVYVLIHIHRLIQLQTMSVMTYELLFGASKQNE